VRVFADEGCADRETGLEFLFAGSMLDARCSMLDAFGFSDYICTINRHILTYKKQRIIDLQIAKVQQSIEYGLG
jgi:hypothetical protein